MQPEAHQPLTRHPSLHGSTFLGGTGELQLGSWNPETGQAGMVKTAIVLPFMLEDPGASQGPVSSEGPDVLSRPFFTHNLICPSVP